MNTVGLYTLGCKVSQYETEAIAESFEARSFRVVPFSDAADVYVINTCTVTAESDRKSRQVIRRALKKNPDAVKIAADSITLKGIPKVNWIYFNSKGVNCGFGQKLEYTFTASGKGSSKDATIL